MDNGNINQRYQELAEKWMNGSITPAEEAEFNDWYLKDQHRTVVVEKEFATDELTQRNRMLATVNWGTPRKPVKLWPRIGVAAAAVAAIVFGLWFLTTRYWNPDRHLDDRRDLLNYANDIAPGGNKATLTVNGKTINLNDAKTGVVVGEELRYNDNTAVISSTARDLLNSKDKRSLRYGGDDGKGATEMTLSTPRGGTYQITLSDGTKVWLNAASSLTYKPNLGKGGARRVKLTGEGYFEVAPAYTSLRGRTSASRGNLSNGRVPFIVESRGQTVEVLGTHFNISAYQGERITTTLLEGSVRIASRHLGDRRTEPFASSTKLNLMNNTNKNRALRELTEGKSLPAVRDDVILKPNQQSIITDNNSAINVKQIDVNTVIAWKNRDFIFDQEDFESILHKVERWYNVEFVYQKGAYKDLKISGTVSRSKNISSVLDALQSTSKLKFKIEGRRITIM